MYNTLIHIYYNVITIVAVVIFFILLSTDHLFFVAGIITISDKDKLYEIAYMWNLKKEIN